MQELERLRDRIDSIDVKILELISVRATVAQKVASAKETVGEEDAFFYRPEREAQVLRRIMASNEGPLGDEEMARVFREIMSACLALEKPVRVAYLGPEGTFAQQSALKHFGRSAMSVPMAAIDEVFREVESGAVNYGVVPVENSSEGVISHTLESFVHSSLRICGEVILRIHQHLLMAEGVREDKITRIYASAQSLAQCRKWLDSYAPMVEKVAVSSNAEAAYRAKEEWNSAAIAGEMVCELYGLKKAAENIEDEADSVTRFLIIGNQDVPASNEDKTSIVVSMRHQPGSLYRLLAPFHCYDIDLVRIESRPSRSDAGNYVFFIDFTGHCDDLGVQSALEEVKAFSSELKVLGSYPKGVF